MRILQILAASMLLILGAAILLLYVFEDTPPPGSQIVYFGPEKITAKSDFAYASALNRAKAYEVQGDLEKAINEYRVAIATDRRVMPSYYPLLDVGRIQCKQGKKAEAEKTLTEFLKYTGYELKRSDDAPFIFFDVYEKQVEFVQKQVRVVKKLLEHCQSSKTPQS